LQEYLQGRKRELPTYVTLSVTGVEHAQEFQVSCVVEGMSAPAVGSGSSRRVAEQQAADVALQILTARDR
ncbi:MAG: ribonuclease III, partial [Halothiobacillaceae bacterium]